MFYRIYILNQIYIYLLFRKNPSGNQVMPWARFFCAVTSTPRRSTTKATRIIPMRINFPPVGSEKVPLSSSFTPFTWYIGNVVDKVCVAAVAARKSAAWNYKIYITFLILWKWIILIFVIINYCVPQLQMGNTQRYPDCLD